MNEWHYCALARDNATGQLIMLHLFPETRQVVKAHDIKSILDLPEDMFTVKITEPEVVS